MKNWIFPLFVTFLFASCDYSKPDSKKLGVTELNADNEVIYKQMGEGFRVMESYCSSCHSWDPNSKLNVAPNFSQIKREYVAKYPEQRIFKDKLNVFLNNPGANTSLLPDWIHVYGVMPKFDLTKEQMEAVGTYLYHSPFEQENWYEVYYPEDKKNFSTVTERISYVELGKKYALQTKAVLGKNLKGAIKANGTEEAVSFCNSRAYPLTDSMSVELNVHIKRVSDQPRNPNNQANSQELNYMKETKTLLASGEKLKPQMNEIDGKMVGYYPITTNAMCLQCHGVVGEQINKEVSMTLKSLYPNDKATGYGENELRGIWVVTMDKY